MTIIIRPAVPDDARAIATVHTRSWQAGYKGVIADHILDAIDVDERTDLWHKILTGEVKVDGLEPPTDLVALVDDQVVGFVNAGPYRDEPADDAGEIWSIYVDPDSWDIGAGARLHDAGIDVFAERGFDRAYLWVLVGNDRAQRFYRRKGWVNDEVIKPDDIDGFPVPHLRYSIALR